MRPRATNTVATFFHGNVPRYLGLLFILLELFRYFLYRGDILSVTRLRFASFARSLQGVWHPLTGGRGNGENGFLVRKVALL